MKKVLLLLFGGALAFPAFNVYSADINALRIHCKSGDAITILLDDSPVVRFDNLNLVIATDNNVVKVASEDAQKITYMNVDPAGITSTEMSDAVFSFDMESLNIRNFTPNTYVSIYTVDGIIAASALTDDYGNVTLSLPGQSATVYILQTPTVSLKLCRP